jgi:hypothetical protein
VSECVRERVSESEFVKKKHKNTQRNYRSSLVYSGVLITAPENFNKKIMCSFFEVFFREVRVAVVSG